MKLPDNYKARKGDVVVIRAKIKFDQEDGEDIHLAIEGATWATVSVEPKYILNLVSRAWESGEKVRVLADGLVGATAEVIAVHEDLVWAKLDDDAHALMTFKATDLESAE